MRDYNPAIGKYLESDPLQLNMMYKQKSTFVVPFLTMMPDALHDYVYAGNNAVNRTDPAGLISAERVCSYVEFAFGWRQHLNDLQQLDMLRNAADANALLIARIQRELAQNICDSRRRELINLLDNAQRRQIWFAERIASILIGLGVDCVY